MQKGVTRLNRSGMFASLAVLGAIAAAAVVPSFFVSEAMPARSTQAEANETVTRGLDNFDIRLSKEPADTEALRQFRSEAGVTGFAIADVRSGFVRGLKAMRSSRPEMKIEIGRELGAPEVITPDHWRASPEHLTAPSRAKRSEILRSFAEENRELLGLAPGAASELEMISDYLNPSGNMGFASLLQKIDGIPVFQAEVKAGFTRNGEMVRVINNLAPGIDGDSVSRDFGDPLEAVKAAAEHIGYELTESEQIVNDKESDGMKTVLGNGDWATIAEKFYFPTEIGVVRPAWRVLIWEPVDTYYVIVDAGTGTMLWRKNITEDQSQAATYDVYRNSAAFIDVADSPAPLTPGPTSPADGAQGALLMRENVALIGNEGALSFNTNGWITDGANSTDGNAVQAGIDRDGINGVDAPQPGDGTCPGTGCRTFTSAWNPPPGNPAPGDDPLTAAAQRGAVIQMFYITNRYHDVMYQFGFTEQAFNFQDSNFGRGGAGSDRVSAEGQDSSGVNNANFSTPSDGGRGRMQMYRFTGANPDRDGTTDADIVIHELTHGTSNRLHGNSSGLTNNMSRGMGEGWSDWYAHTLLSEPTDPIHGIYTTGGYVLVTPTYSGNYYYGIRRFPKAVMAFTGGPSNRPHNPLTFADLNVGCDLSDGAFSPRGGGSCDQVHNAGEIWSSALWEVRAQMIARLGFAQGNARVLQVVTDGMKLAPIGPTFLQERDAIIAAAYAGSSAALGSGSNPDVQDVWEGFRIRGMGFSAEVVSPSPAQVVEAFDLPNVVVAEPGFSVSDQPGDNDGYPEPGERLTVTVPLSNATGAVIDNVTVSVNGGPTVNYGTIVDGATVSNAIQYTVPAATGCGSAFDLDITINGSRGTREETRRLVLGEPANVVDEDLDSVTAPALPAGWTAAQTGPGVAFVTTTTGPDSAPNSLFTPNTGTAGGNSGATVESPQYSVNTDAAVLRFRNKYDTEAGWDGGVLEISVNGGAFQDILAAGGSFLEGGYNGTLGANQNPLDNRAAWTGNSGGYIDTVVALPASVNGSMVRFRWRFGEDTNTFSVGWNVDGIEFVPDFGCNAAGTTARMDFDGDGKTDPSVFRASPSSAVESVPGPEGSTSQWWVYKSSDQGNFAVTFGTPDVAPVPRDFTGDGKADIAFFRPSDSNWFVLRSEDMTFYAFPFGAAGDIPAPGDFDGDGKADAAVFRPASGTWFIFRSSDQGVTITSFGAQGDWPTVADFDGDGTDDIAIWRTSDKTWWQLRSTDGLIAYQFGTPNALHAAVGDYTGDGKADAAFFDQSTQFWYVLRSEDQSYYAFPWGAPGDVAAPGDYDGDGKVDAAIFRPSNSTWYIDGTSSGFSAVPFGTTGDTPLPSVGLNG